MAEASTPAVSDIDHLYLDAIGAVDSTGRLDKAKLRHLIDRLEAPGMAQASDDSCFQVKRLQMLPILFSLAMIDGLAGDASQQELRLAARSDLVALSTAHSDAAYRDACNGRGFPAVSNADGGASDDVRRRAVALAYPQRWMLTRF
jgi:hypothetical protein